MKITSKKISKVKINMINSIYQKMEKSQLKIGNQNSRFVLIGTLK